MKKETEDTSKKIPDASGLKKKADYINSLAVTAALNDANNKISDGSNLVKETEYDAKILKI